MTNIKFPFSNEPAKDSMVSGELTESKSPDCVRSRRTEFDGTTDTLSLFFVHIERKLERGDDLFQHTVVIRSMTGHSYLPKDVRVTKTSRNGLGQFGFRKRTDSLSRCHANMIANLRHAINYYEHSQAHHV